jgi:putative ATP-dependent endonuclease of OLD family
MAQVRKEYRSLKRKHTLLLKKVTIKNFRGFNEIEVELDQTTVLIGENNTGKTSFLEAIRFCLERLRSRKTSLMESYDHHLLNHNCQPGEAGTLSIELDFAEETMEEWSPEITQQLLDVITLHTDTDNTSKQHVTLRLCSKYEQTTGDFTIEWDFLNLDGVALRKKNPQLLANLQRLVPIFYLSALRDAAREFHARSSFWSPFLRNPAIDPQTRQHLEERLNSLNQEIINAHDNLQKVKEYLTRTNEIVALAREPVCIDALPARIADMLSRTHVSMIGTTGASIPLERHGAGTQSLSVIFLFEAFLNSVLAEAYDPLSSPILALEEPEAHLHPSAIRTLWRFLDTIKGQKIIATHSGDLLARVPITAIRRFCRRDGGIKVCQLQPATLNNDERRKIDFHIRNSRGELLFARCWLLVEGETEYWLFNEVADILGYDLDALGIRVVTYSAGGLEPLIKVANDLGIDWYVLADGDQEGRKKYAKVATDQLPDEGVQGQIVLLCQNNIELFLCTSGYGYVFNRHISEQKRQDITASQGDDGYWEQVLKARDNVPKPAVIREIADEIHGQGAEAVPQLLQDIILSVVHLAERCL